MMRVVNVHSRELRATADRVGSLIDSLASADDALWPKHVWPRMELDPGLEVGARGGHGPIRYVVKEYVPGESVTFGFTAPAGFDGFHRLERMQSGPNATVLRHSLEMTAHGAAVVSWLLVYRPMHDALLEDALATAEASLGLPPRVQAWSLWVRLARWAVSRGKAGAQSAPKSAG